MPRRIPTLGASGTALELQGIQPTEHLAHQSVRTFAADLEHDRARSAQQLRSLQVIGHYGPSVFSHSHFNAPLYCAALSVVHQLRSGHTGMHVRTTPTPT